MVAGYWKTNRKEKSMTAKQAKEKLIILRKKQNRLRKQIDELREFLRQKNVNPDAPAIDLTKRNQAIYKRYLAGLSYTEIGKIYNLSPGRIRNICKRGDVVRKKK